MRRFADVSGLDIVELQPIGGIAEVLADMFAKYLQFVPIVGHRLAWFVQALARRFGGTRPGRLLFERTAAAFPLGYVMVATRPRSH